MVCQTARRRFSKRALGMPRASSKNPAPAPQWPADQVERRSVAELEPYARNARTHSGEQVAQLAASIDQWGWTVPVLVDEGGMIIAGHGRVLAAQLLGLETVPVVVARGWSEDQKRAYALADNRLPLNAAWDEDLLAAELSDLHAVGFDLAVAGFNLEEIAGYAATATSGLTDPDAAPAVQPALVSRIGDVWLCGRHRLACGDSTDPSVAARAIGALKPNLMVTDPPYGVKYDAAWRNRAGVSQSKRTGAVANDHRANWWRAWMLFPGDVAYVWHSAVHARTVSSSLEAAGFAVRAEIIWAKPSLVLGRGDYHWQHEPCLYVVRKDRTSGWQGARDQTTLWEIATLTGSAEDAETVHATQKPVECMKRPIVNNSAPGAAIYEPFSGSGSTIIAAEMTGRAVCAIELTPKFVDVAVRRWQAFTGERATLERTGDPFPVDAPPAPAPRTKTARGASPVPRSVPAPA